MKARQAHQELYSERNSKTSENENGGVEGDDGEDPQRQKKLLLPLPHVSAGVWVGLRDPGAYRSPDWILLFTPTQSQCDTSHPIVAPSTTASKRNFNLGE